ncbi:MAG: RNA polymerase factor sigma-54 [Elioraea tepidiphila]
MHRPRGLARRSLLAGLPLATTGCGIWDWAFGGSKQPLPGERRAVLPGEAEAASDPSLADVPVELPPPVTNAAWPVAGGTPSNVMGHLAAPDRLQVAWRTGIGTGGSQRRPLLTTPIVADGRVYACDATAEVTALALSLGCGRERIEAVLGRMQRFDPPGVLARSLRECLEIQLRELNRYDPAMAALLDNLDLLARRDMRALMSACEVDAEDLADMIAELKRLDPKPGAAFEAEPATTVVPDVLMRRTEDGSWIVELNPETLPRVLANGAYYARVSAGAKSREEKTFIAEHWANATWLVKSLAQRASTILKVAAEIVRQQDAFFRHGITHLRPLILRDIATAVELHESTVSRVTANKYIATPRGTLEMKFFFTTAIAGTGGEAHSSESVRHRIRELIAAEHPDAVLSDDQIVTILKREGVDIARRTVAKYREGLGIPSSVQRRREKAIPA